MTTEHSICPICGAETMNTTLHTQFHALVERLRAAIDGEKPGKTS